MYTNVIELKILNKWNSLTISNYIYLFRRPTRALICKSTATSLLNCNGILSLLATWFWLGCLYCQREEISRIFINIVHSINWIAWRGLQFIRLTIYNFHHQKCLPRKASPNVLRLLYKEALPQNSIIIKTR